MASHEAGAQVEAEPESMSLVLPEVKEELPATVLESDLALAPVQSAAPSEGYLKVLENLKQL